jgi:hypothetical protein
MRGKAGKIQADSRKKHIAAEAFCYLLPEASAGEEWRKAGGKSTGNSLRLPEMWESIAQVVGEMS